MTLDSNSVHPRSGLRRRHDVASQYIGVPGAFVVQAILDSIEPYRQQHPLSLGP